MTQLMPVIFEGIPGPLGDLTTYLRDNDEGHDGVRALATAISTILALARGAYAVTIGQYTTLTDIFIVSVARSSSGKTSMLRRASALVNEAFPRHPEDPLPLYQIGAFGSPEGLWDFLSRLPERSHVCACVLVVDECGDELKDLANERSYKRSILRQIRALTNAGTNTVSPPPMSMRAKGPQRAPLQFPVVGFLGFSTATQFLEPLGNDRLLADGTEARMLVLSSPDTDEVDTDANAAPSFSLRDGLRRLAASASEVVHRARAYQAPERISIFVPPEIDKRVKELRADTTRRSRQMERDGDRWSPLLGRRMEHILKLAMAFAISESPDSPALSNRALDWASRVVDFAHEGHMALRSTHVSRSERSLAQMELRSRMLDQIKRLHSNAKRRKAYVGVYLRDVMKNLNLGRDEAAKEANSLIAQGRVLAFDADGNALTEVQPRGDTTLLRPVT